MGSADPLRKKLVVTLNISTCISLPKLPTDRDLCYHPFWVLVSRFSALHTTLCLAGVSQFEGAKFLCFLSQSGNTNSRCFHVWILDIWSLTVSGAAISGMWLFTLEMQYLLDREERGTQSLSTESKKQSFEWSWTNFEASHDLEERYIYFIYLLTYQLGIYFVFLLFAWTQSCLSHCG